MIRSVSALNVHMPLNKPFKNLDGDYHHMDFTVVIIEQDHRTGIGALTVYPGSSEITINDLWEFARAKGGDLIGENPRWALNNLCMESGKSLVCAIPFIVSLEGMLDLITAPEISSYPLSGIADEHNEPKLTIKVMNLLEQGFKIIRVEGGRDVGSDISRVKRIQSLAGKAARVRFDAHQGYSYDEARFFIETVETSALEMLEEPFAPGEWEKTAALAEWSSVPIMLDESIKSDADLERAAGLGCCRYVKCGLMRACGFSGLIQRIKRCRELGFHVVVGSDAGCDIQCYYEAVAAAFLGLKAPGDMNGFLLQMETVLEQPLNVVKGCLSLPKNSVPVLNIEALERHVVNRIRWASSDDIEPITPGGVRKKTLVKLKTR